MRIIDFHTHVYPEKIAAKAVENVGAFYGLEMHGGGTIEQLIENGSKVGVSDFVIHSPAITPHNVATINTFMADQMQQHKEIHAFGTLHADLEDYTEEIERISELGLKGVKIHPDSQGFNMDDDKMMPMYKLLEKKDIPVLFHCGDYRYDFSHPRRLSNVIDSFPNLTVIAAHFGGWSVQDLALEYLKDRNCYLDVSSSLSYIGSVRAKELIDAYTPERILFGSDFPMWTPEEELEKFMQIDLSDDAREKILFTNAANILKL